MPGSHCDKSKSSSDDFTKSLEFNLTSRDTSPDRKDYRLLHLTDEERAAHAGQGSDTTRTVNPLFSQPAQATAQGVEYGKENSTSRGGPSQRGGRRTGVNRGATQAMVAAWTPAQEKAFFLKTYGSEHRKSDSLSTDQKSSSNPS